MRKIATRKMSRLVFSLLILFAFVFASGCGDSSENPVENTKNAKITEKALAEKKQAAESEAKAREAEKKARAQKMAEARKTVKTEATLEKLAQMAGTWYSLPVRTDDEYHRPGGDVRFTLAKNGYGDYKAYIDVGKDGENYQIHFDLFAYDAETGEIIIMFMNDTITGQPYYHAGPQKKKLTEMVGEAFDFYTIVGSARLIPGNPEKLTVSLRGITTRDFDLAFNVDYELVRQEYAHSLGAAAQEAKTVGNITDYYLEPHWLTGQWTTSSGDRARFVLNRSGMSSAIWQTKEDGSLLKGSNDFISFDLLWDDVEKAWAMVNSEGGGVWNIHQVLGYIRPSSGSAEVASQTIDLEIFGYKWPSWSGNEVWSAKATMKKSLAALPTEVYVALFGIWSSQSGEKVTMKLSGDEFQRTIKIGKSASMSLPTNSGFLWDVSDSQLVIINEFNKLKLVGTFSEDGKTLTLKGGDENINSFQAVLTNPNGAGFPKGFLPAGRPSGNR